MKKLVNLFRRGPDAEPSAQPAADDSAPAQVENSVDFAALGVVPEILKALASQGYERPTPIQIKAIPSVIEGRDVLGSAQTGTGKTAAFAVPILQRLITGAATGTGKPGAPRVLVLAPTRELAIQIHESFMQYGANTRIKACVIFGGVGQTPQVDALRRRPEIIVATPGRLMDLMGQGYVNLEALTVFVLDEADRMLDMGFIHDIRKIIAVLPKMRQNLLFSATMPPDIQKLADQILRDPVKVAAQVVSSTAETVTQQLYFVEKSGKPKLLVHLLNGAPEMSRVIAFTRTKHGANRLAETLNKSGITAEAIHGNKSQTARQRALANFKSGTTRVLVASDLAARGLDIDEVTHVFNIDLPEVPETYVHRIGRTGRAAALGAAVAFCSQEEKPLLAAIERITKQKVPVVSGHPFEGGALETDEDLFKNRRGGGGGRGRGGPPRGGGGGGGQSRGGGGGGGGGPQRGGSGGGGYRGGDGDRGRRDSGGGGGGQSQGSRGDGGGQSQGSRGDGGGQSQGARGDGGGQSHGSRGDGGGQSQGSRGDGGGQSQGSRGEGGGQSQGSRGDGGGQSQGSRGDGGGSAPRSPASRPPQQQQPRPTSSGAGPDGGGSDGAPSGGKRRRRGGRGRSGGGGGGGGGSGGGSSGG